MTPLVWRHSSSCDSGSCLEVAFAEGHVYLRDSEHGPVLEVTPAEWLAFTDGIKAGELKMGDG